MRTTLWCVCLTVVTFGASACSNPTIPSASLESPLHGVVLPDGAAPVLKAPTATSATVQDRIDEALNGCVRRWLHGGPGGTADQAQIAACHARYDAARAAEAAANQPPQPSCTVETCPDPPPGDN